MLPFNSPHDVADVSLVNAELGGQLRLRLARILAANAKYVLFCELGSPVRLTERVTAFLFLVQVVIGDGAGEKVRRITARRVIAGMKHVLSMRHWSFGFLKGQAMRSYLSPCVVGDDAISVLVDRARPRPAGFRLALYGVFGKAHGKRKGSGLVCARSRAVVGVLSGDLSHAAVFATSHASSYYEWSLG